MIVTSDFTNPGVYYGEASKVDNLSTEVNFVVEVRRNKGINFYFESDNDIVEVKAFSDKTLKWTKYDNSYETANLAMGDIYLKLIYIIEDEIFQLYWNSTSTLTSNNGSTGKVHSYYLPNATELYSPVNITSSSRSISTTKMVFLIIGFIIAIIAAGFSGIYINRYLFFS